MVININDKVYRVSKEDYEKILKTVAEAKKGSYFIYCVERKGLALFVDELFKEKDELRKQVASYVTEGFKVRYTVKEVEDE